MENIPPWITTAFLLLLLLVHSANSEEDDVKRSLIAFLQKLAPGNPDIAADLGWTVSSDPCAGDWTNVKCNNRTSSVRNIALEGLSLTGSIDADLLCSARSVTVLSLRNNRLIGSLPSGISNCSSLTHLYLSDNRLSGSLPPSLPLLKNLKRLELSNNSFSDKLPQDLAKISGLITFLVNDNRLNGSIPEFDFGNLQSFNASDNLFSGPIPTSAAARFGREAFLDNPGLCGEPLAVACPPTSPVEPVESKSNSKKEKIIMYSGYLILCLAFVIFVAYKIVTRRKRGDDKKSLSDSKKSSSSSTKTSRSDYSIAASNEQSPAAATMSLVVLKNPVVSELRFENLLKAPAELLGRGRFGTLYKVVMADGTELAVKRIKDWTVSAQEFQRRMERIDRAKHPRVLSAIAFYCSKQEKLVVYEYKPNGSLFKLLHGRKEGSRFDWSSRLTIAAGIADGLAFMHKDLHELGIGHGNLKSSNILLDANMDPCISEYGLLAVPKQTATASLNTSSSSSGRRSVNPVNDSAIHADTYGFGVILLELLTGKVVQNNGFDLAKWVHSVVREEWTAEVFDPALMAEGVGEGALVTLLHIALKCIDPSVNSRPSMSHVAKLVHALREEEDSTSSVSEFDLK